MAKEEIKSLRNEDVENQNLDFLEALILDYEDKREEATECDAWSQEEVRKECRSERNQLSERSNDEREKSADRRP